MLDQFGPGILTYGLIMARIIGLLFTAPVFSGTFLPNQTRMILALALSAALYPVTAQHLDISQAHPVNYIIAVLGQVTIGVLIGFMMGIIFAAFQMAGEMFSMQMGLSFSEVLDPQSQVSIPVIGTLKSMIGLLIFVAVHFEMSGLYAPAYLHLIRALAVSFEMVPELLITDQVTGGILNHIDQALGVMFETAIKIAFPIMGILFITSLALGLLGRAAPQMNLMNMGLQLNIIVGTILVIILIPVIVPLMRDALYISFGQIDNLFATWPRGAGGAQ